ncbi:MAG: hypothetical protein WDN30_05675 [Pararobbsia sp.]
MSDARIVRVALDHPLATLYDYRWHEPTPPRIGQLVGVPFGKRSAVGVIFEVANHTEVSDARLARRSNSRVGRCRRCPAPGAN